MRFFVFVAALSISACSTPGLVDTGRVGIVTSEQLPRPTASDMSRGARPHLVGPFDQIAVEVFGLPELSRQVQVDASGHIAFPLAGNLEVAGQTPQDLETLIAERLRASYVKNPQVSVSIVQTVSQLVTVGGQVRKPGMYPVAGPMTLMRAIARAEGMTDNAKSDHVVLFRTVEGRQLAILHDVRSIERGAYEDPAVYPQDLVVVGESQARRLFPQIVQGVGLLLSPLVTVLGSTRK